MQQYSLVTGRQLKPLPPKPVFSDFYVPSEDRHNRELTFISLSIMIGIGAFSKYYRYMYLKKAWYLKTYIDTNSSIDFEILH